MRRSPVELSPVKRIKGGVASVGHVVDFVRKQCVLPESRKRMTLHRFQLDLIESWHDPSTLCDVAVIAAGNAKTTTLGAYLTAHIFLDHEASVPIIAETVTQAVLTTWGKIKRFVELNPELERRAEILEGQGARRGVYVPGMGSHAFPLASKPAGIQGLNPSRGVLEELSEHSVETFGALMNRLGKRDHSPAGSKVVGITTPSFTPDNALLHVQRAVHGEAEPIPGVRLTEYVSDQADHRDERGWRAANPGLKFGMPAIGAIRTDLAMLPEQQFRAYRLCQNPKGSKSCWLNSIDDETDEETGDGYEVWMRGESAYKLRPGAPTWAGVDVAKSRDHAAVVWGQFRDDGRLHTKCKVWTPTSEADIDLEAIADHLRMLAGKYRVKAVWYDPSYFYNAPALERELPMVEVPPTDQRMAPLVGHCYQSIRRTRVTHDGDEQFTSHVLAAKRKYGTRGFTIEKIHFGHKIDAAVALVLCHGAAHGLSDPDYSLDDLRPR